MKYAPLNFLLGAAIAGQAWWYRGLAIPLVWLGASFCVLGLAYWLRRPGLLGKHSDGTISWWSWVCLLPLHLYIRSVWFLHQLISTEPAFSWVTPGLAVGRRLHAGELPEGIKVVVDLTSEFTESARVRHGREYRLFPILDATVPDRDSLRQFIASLPSGPTYVHCAQGHGRTGLFSMAWLLETGACHSLAEAEALLLQARPGIRLNREQRAFINSCFPPSRVT